MRPAVLAKVLAAACLWSEVWAVPAVVTLTTVVTVTSVTNVVTVTATAGQPIKTDTINQPEKAAQVQPALVAPPPIDPGPAPLLRPAAPPIKINVAERVRVDFGGSLGGTELTDASPKLQALMKATDSIVGRKELEIDGIDSADTNVLVLVHRERDEGWYLSMCSIRSTVDTQPGEALFTLSLDNPVDKPLLQTLGHLTMSCELENFAQQQGPLIKIGVGIGTEMRFIKPPMYGQRIFKAGETPSILGLYRADPKQQLVERDNFELEITSTENNKRHRCYLELKDKSKDQDKDSGLGSDNPPAEFALATLQASRPDSDIVPATFGVSKNVELRCDPSA